MANKLRPANSPGVANADPKAEELPNNLQDELAKTLLTLLHTISSKATESKEDLPTEATRAIARFHGISCALATVSDKFDCAALPPQPDIEG